MEHEEGFHHYRRHAKSGSDSPMSVSPTQQANTNSSTSDMSNNNNERVPQQCLIREQDQYMPIANVIRIMRRILPSHAKISDDAKETIQECVSEYISFITGEANERCQREQRKTVTAEDVLWAMAKLGFDDYIDPLTIFLNRYRESENDRTRVEPLFRRGGSAGAVDYGPQVGMMGTYGPGFQMGHVAPVFDPATMGMGVYYSAGPAAGSSSGNGNLGSFDPFSQFK